MGTPLMTGFPWTGRATVTPVNFTSAGSLQRPPTVHGLCLPPSPRCFQLHVQVLGAADLPISRLAHLARGRPVVFFSGDLFIIHDCYASSPGRLPDLEYTQPNTAPQSPLTPTTASPPVSFSKRSCQPTASSTSASSSCASPLSPSHLALRSVSSDGRLVPDRRLATRQD
ncbi:hypothetical protein N657DRAFT_703179 [Parathielavia appendiculata]|uniref:Uncharacterized protein n=1 Tax=Parathielavia appendiculata TaxID=2587402 RepID=A0AAN6U5I6_9PEZI|nr:hypothetical protein N657DRAFT_703179 [Parathielavia appendiculata]